MRQLLTMSAGFVGSTVLALGLNILSAQAADTTAPTDTGETLQEVIVTAEKRTENAQKIAIAITTISGDDITKHAENELDSALRNVPSLQVESTPQGGEIYIRGVGANGDSNFIDPSVALFFDGVYNGARSVWQPPCMTSITSKCCAVRRARSTVGTPTAARSM